MPSVMTHALIARDSAKYFSPNLLEAVKLHPDYYFLGAQGPDVFFFYRPLSGREGNLGRFLHRSRVYTVFEFFLSCLRGEHCGAEYARLLAYVAGYITHYAADTVFHPYLYRYLEKTPKAGMAHQQIENDWDVYFLRTMDGREVERFPFPFSAKKIIKENTLFNLYARLIEEIGQRSLKKRKFNRALKNFERYLNFFHKNCYGTQKRIERAEKFFRITPRLSCLFPRKTPWQEVIDGDFYPDEKNAETLYQEAVEKSRHLVQTFTEGLLTGALPRAGWSKSFLTAEEV